MLKSDSEMEGSTMSLPHITRFCCCMSLEAGSIVIGLVHMLISIGLTTISSLFAEEFRTMIGTVEDAGDHLYTTWYIIASVVVMFCVVHFMLATTLLYGLFKNKPRVLRAWVWLMMVLWFSAIGFVLLAMACGFNHTGSHIFLDFMEGVLMFGAIAYCILCVNSLYLKRLAEEMDRPKPDNEI